VAEQTAPSPAERAPYRAWVAHSARRRLRLRLDGKTLDADAAQRLADRLASVDGVSHVVFRPNTGSLIVETLSDAAGVLERLRTHPALEVKPAPKPPPVGQVIQMGMMKADMGLGQRTDGALDLRTAIALLLAFGAIVQLSRGRVAGPATTLAMSAFALLDKGLPPARR
jgi:hypothetical protein